MAETQAQIILLPAHPRYPYLRYSESGLVKNVDTNESEEDQDGQGEEDEVLLFSSSDPSCRAHNETRAQLPLSTREELRAYMILHQVKGTKTMPIRTPFVGEISTFESPAEPGVKFGIRRLSNGQVMAHRDRNSVVRFVTESGDDDNERYIQERDYPTGTMTVDIAVLGLATWNLQDDQGNAIPINQETILKYLDPEELDFVSEKVLEVNPIISNRNQKKRTRDDTSSSDGVPDGGDDTPTVREVLPPVGVGSSTTRDLRGS